MHRPSNSVSNASDGASETQDLAPDELAELNTFLGTSTAARIASQEEQAQVPVDPLPVRGIDSETATPTVITSNSLSSLGRPRDQTLRISQLEASQEESAKQNTRPGILHTASFFESVLRRPLPPFDRSNEAQNANDPFTYDLAFRLIQHAADAERSGDPLYAIELYEQARTVLVRVGERERDGLLRQAIVNKTNEIGARARQVEDWYHSVQRRNMCPPAIKIQRMEVPSVRDMWCGRQPPYSDDAVFTHMRYTAVTTKDPMRFSFEGFELLVKQCERTIRTLIAVRIFDEDDFALKDTLTGIAQNLESMTKNSGINAWKSVAVVLISDGRTKANQTSLNYLANLGAFDEEIMTITSVGVDVQMHLFESTIQLHQDDNMDTYYPPLQLIYALKEHHSGKLNSHLWFFDAFAEHLLPAYTVLIDVGTVPGPDSIWRMIRTMDRNRQIGGVAGEVVVNKPDYFNMIVAAQHFEYKISNIMDKSLESVFGFISVLPAAFSAYRYEAIRFENESGPLCEYFRSITTPATDLGPLQRNMYLAEDRILCVEMLVRNECNWTMHYVKKAIARTNVPKTLVALIKQRRRWLSGSFSAGFYAVSNFSRVWTESGHSFLRKIVLTMGFLYLLVQHTLTWFLLGNMFLTVYYVLTLLLFAHAHGLLQGVLAVNLALVGGVVIFALGSKPEKRTAAFYTLSFSYFGVIIMIVTGVSIYGLAAGDSAHVQDPRKNLATCSIPDFYLTTRVTAAFGFIFVAAFLHGEFQVVLSAVQYLFSFPSFVNILGVYAYSHSLDINSGAKRANLEALPTAPFSGGGHSLKQVLAAQRRLEAAREQASRENEDVDNSFRAFRSTLLLSWLVSNCIWMFAMTSFVSSSCYLLGLSSVVAAFNATRFLGATIYLVFQACRGFGFLVGVCSEESATPLQDSTEWHASHPPRSPVAITSPAGLKTPHATEFQVLVVQKHS